MACPFPPGPPSAQLRGEREGLVRVRDRNVDVPARPLTFGEVPGGVHDPGDWLAAVLDRAEPELGRIAHGLRCPAERGVVERHSAGVITGVQPATGAPSMKNIK